MLRRRRHVTSRLERLEDRRLLAVNLVGHWTADDLREATASGEPVAAWSDSVANISATAEGQPLLIENALNGHSVVRFTPSDGRDLLRVDANDSPMAGVNDFSVAVVFSTSSTELVGEESEWYLNSGLVDTNLVGFVQDWGLVINGHGQVAAGLGRPATTQYSTLAGLNDGGAHVAIYTRSGGTITLYTDGTVDARTDGGTAARAARDITFGALQTGRSPYDGDIAEVRLYDTQLSNAEANDLTNQLLAQYFNFSPTANDDAYTVDEDSTLVVSATDGVLANDSDLEQDPIAAELVDQPQHGTLELSADGSFVYQPTPNFQGEDSFSYAARDQRNSEPATVTIQVFDRYDAPIGVPDAYLLIADRSFSVGESAGVLSNDVSLGAADVTVALVEDVDHGTLMFADDGSFNYTPNVSFVGTDVFTYEVSDGITTALAVSVKLIVNEHTVTISEIAADNRDTLIDKDGDSPDWLELYNYGDQPADLDGWFLTDDPGDLTGWRFPAVSLAPGQFLTVFASGKDRTDVTGDLHTDFKLASRGDYLALVAEDGETIVSELTPSFPPQFTDVSYGLSATAISVSRFDTGYLTPATPGAINNGAIELGPIVGDVHHEPVAPASGEDLTVSARFHPLGPPTVSVTLAYRVMYGDEFSTFMFDDGTIGGDVAGDGIYTGVISADQIEAAYLAGGGIVTDLAGTMLRYRISTLDVEARSFSAPYLPNPANTNGLPEYFGTVIQTPEINTALPVFQWFVPDPEWHKTGNGNNKNWSSASVFFDGEFYDNVQVRVRGQSTVNWSKPKFKFEFNRGHEFRYSDHEARVDEFNLLSHFIEKGAVSYMGENLAFQFLQDIGVAAPNTFHMHVRQNGDFYSLASFIEQIDATFLARNGFDPHGPMYKANSPSARSTLAPNPTASHYRKVTEKDEAWGDIVEFTNGINDLILEMTRAEYIFDHVNLPEVINDMAGNVILINHDRLTKNYYVYWDQNGNGEWSRFPWDMDQAFAIRTDNIFASVLYGDSEHPQSPDPIHQNHLYDAILDTPFTREMYLQRIRTLMDDFLGSAAGGYFEQGIDAYHDLIADDAALDHAKWSAGNISAGVARLKNNLQFRRTQLEAEPLVPDAPTQIDIRFDDIDFDPASGDQDEEYIEIQNFGPSAVDVSGWSLAGGVTMTFQPGTVIPAGGSLFASPDVVAFRARTSGPSGGQALFVQGNYDGHISNFGELFRLLDDNGNQMDITTTTPAPTDVQQYLRISEVHYNPAGASDTEFIEFTNISSGANTKVLDLAGVTISGGPGTPFVFADGVTLEPGAHALVVEDQAAFRTTYANVDAALIVGEYTGGLANGGERIKLDDANGNTVVSFEYKDDDPWPVRADGAGASLELVDVATPREQFGKYYHWRASSAFGGSPGTAGSTPLGVVVNEVRTGEAVDQIELLNTTDREIDVGGWYLSDSRNDLLKFAIPDGTILGAGQYVVFDEEDFNPTPGSPGPKDFGLSSTDGDDVWLVIGNGQGGVRTFVDDVHFGPSPPGETIGRTPNGTGRFAPLAAATIGCGNAHPRIGPVVMSEVHYAGSQPSAPALSIAPNLTATDLEFVELYNPTDSSISLSQWRLRGGIDMEFADGTNLAPDQVLLVVSFDPSDPSNANQVSALRIHYGIDENVTLIGGYSGNLNNGGEVVRLERLFEGPIAASHIHEDEVLYDDLAPWPLAADGGGSSLQRLSPVYLGNSVTSWTARTPSPGSVDFTGNVWGDFNGDGVVGAVDIDMLNGAVHSENTVSFFDLDGNSIVDVDDVAMLVEQVVGTTFGDANLDGVVDGSDFNIWNDHKFDDCFSSWADGDFTSDGVVDGSDFNVWMNNRFTGGQPMAGAGNERLVGRTPRQALASVRLGEHNASALVDSLVRSEDTSLESTKEDYSSSASGTSDSRREVLRMRYSRQLADKHRFLSKHQADDSPKLNETSTMLIDQLFITWPQVNDLTD